MARYYRGEDLIECARTTWCDMYDLDDFLAEVPTADVVPKSEVERLEHICHSYALQYGSATDKQKVIDKAKREALSDLKKQIHDRAVYPHNAGISPYVSLKVVDALINNLIGS